MGAAELNDNRPQNTAYMRLGIRQVKVYFSKNSHRK
jgi:hypothetical protein